MLRRVLVSLLGVTIAACDGDPMVIAPRPAADPALKILDVALTPAQLGQEYSAKITAEGGSGLNYTWSTEGELPPGLTIAAQGTPDTTISGTPSRAGDDSFTVVVRDSKNATATRVFSLTIERERLPPLLVTTSTLPAGATGIVYTATLTASGGVGDYFWSIGSGALPTGLTLAADGIISGAPAESGEFLFVAEVRDSAGAEGERELVINVEQTPPPLVLDTIALPFGAAGSPYSVMLAAHGGRPPYSWTISGGTLPTGLMLEGDMISGTPERSGSVQLVIGVHDARGVAKYASLSLVILSQLRFDTTTLPDAEGGRSYGADLEAAGGSRANYTWSIVQGELPPGLMLAPTGTPTTTISGIPTLNGEYVFTVRVEDDLGHAVEQVFSIAVLMAPPPLIMVTAAAKTATVGEPYIEQISASGGVEPYNWSVTAGSLPPGLQMAIAGTPSTIISGTPVLAGTWEATITVFDFVNEIATRTYTFEVVPPGIPLSILTTTLPIAINGEPYTQTISGIGGAARNYRWALVGAPPGLSITAQGTPDATLSGTLTQLGSHIFTVELRDDQQNLAVQQLTLPVNDRVALPRHRLPLATLGVAFTASITATGGAGVGYSWAVSDGVLPVGLTLVGNGISATLFGIPEQAGSFSFELTVSDTTSSASRRFDIPVSGPQRYAVWAGDSEVDNDFALYVADLVGATPLRISPVNPGFAAIELTEQSLKLSPANDKVLFLGDFTTDEVRELYLVDLAGPAPEVARRVNNTLVSGGDVVEFVWSPDGEQVLYLADQDVDGTNELYLVEVGSGVPGPSLKINNTLQAAGDVEANSFMFSPDGTKILYLADQTLDDQRELWIADISGTTPAPAVRVNFQLPNTVADIDTNLRFSPNSGKVFYLADQLGIGSTELWVADVGPPPAPPPARVNGLLSAGRNVSTLAGSVQVSPDGAYVAYLADQTTNDAFELYLVDYRGFPPTPPIKLNLSLPIDRDVVSFLFSPDGSRLVYVADQDAYGIFELYYVDLAGSAPTAPVKINELFQTNGDVRWQDGLQFSPDGAFFAYFADANLDDWRELFVVDLGGPLPGLPISVLSPGSGLTPQRFDFSPDGTRIALANEQLWISELSPSGVPSAADAVTPFFVGGLRVAGFHWLRDSQRLFVYGDLRSDEVFEVYLSGITPGTPLPMHPLPPSGGDARTVLVPPF